MTSFAPVTVPVSTISPKHFKWEFDNGVATITLNRPERKNPLTFESYAELRDTFYLLRSVPEVKIVVITGEGGNFCSGGDVHDIIGPLTRSKMPEILAFTRMTGDLIREIRACPQPVICAVDGVCVGAGSVISLASDLRYATARSKTAFLFVRVGLAGCDMGACAMLPRAIGGARASELLYTGRVMSGEEGERWGYYNAVIEPDQVLAHAQKMARSLVEGPTFAHSMTKKMLEQEWVMSISEAIESEAQAQAICMFTEDYKRAYNAFVAKQKPAFKGD